MPTKEEQRYIERVAAIGCLVCLNNGYEDTPADIHHIRAGQGMSQRASAYETLPLCKIHHQTGDGTVKYKFQVGLHHNTAAFEKKYGTELELLEQVRRILGLAQ